MKMFQISLIVLLLVTASHATPQPETGAYAIVTVQMGAHSYDAIRWNRASGESYLLRNQAWQPIPEADDNSELPDGSYDVQFIPLQNDWGAIRINTETGESWTMAEGQWIPIESAPAEPVSEDLDIESLIPSESTTEESVDPHTDAPEVIEVQPE